MLNTSNQRKHNESLNNKKNSTANKVLNICAIVFALIAHIAVILFVVFSYKYYGLEIKTVIFALIIIALLLLLVDVLLIVGLNVKDKIIIIISLVISVLLSATFIVGSIYVVRINKTVDNITDNSGVDQYETIGGVFACYQGNEFTSIEELNGKKVGILKDAGIGTGSLAKEKLAAANVNVEFVEYNTTDELLIALVDGLVDTAVFPISYRQRYTNASAEDESDFVQYLEKITDFYSFEEKVKTGENKNANMDLSTEPFNILLIGFAPEDEAMTYGLADSIIIATVNPKTMTVCLTSIARDSYVNISGYNYYDKINAARGISRECLMNTVGDLMGIDLDFYMEVNFLGVVEIVDALGGLYINSPVEFTGQSPSGIRGDYTVWVPAGPYFATGEQVLAYARERHAMPNGDFDRQLHQQEVIKEIVKSLLDLKDVNKALDVMEAAGNNISTNLSMSQLTGVFNYLISAENNMGVPTFGMIDIQTMRVTGYASWYYSYSLRFPQWIYKLYDGSIKECKDRINDVMNNYSEGDIEQDDHFRFFVQYPYNREQLYSDYFEEAQVHEEMPDYYATLTGMTYEQAVAWAATKGVTLDVTVIAPGEAGYVAGYDGYVYSQSPRAGALVSEYPVGQITVMGSIDGSITTKKVVNCSDHDSCVLWANKNRINYQEQSVYTFDNSISGFIGTYPTNGSEISSSDTLYIQSYVYIDPPSSMSTVSEYQSWVSNHYGINGEYTPVSTDDPNQDGMVINASASGSTITVTYYKYEQTGKACKAGDGNTGCTSCSDGSTLVGGTCQIVCSAGDGNTGCTYCSSGQLDTATGTCKTEDDPSEIPSNES